MGLRPSRGKTRSIETLNHRTTRRRIPSTHWRVCFRFFNSGLFRKLVTINKAKAKLSIPYLFTTFHLEGNASLQCIHPNNTRQRGEAKAAAVFVFVHRSSVSISIINNIRHYCRLSINQASMLMGSEQNAWKTANEHLLLFTFI